MKHLKLFLTFVIAWMTGTVATLAAVGDTFTAENSQGVIITYMVTDADASTVKTYGEMDPSTYEATTCLVSNNSSSPISNVIIPSTVRFEGTDYAVTGIDGYSFYNCYDLQSVTIPEGVLFIGEGAFYQTGLTSVTIPSSVETLGVMAFGGCENLNEVICACTTPPILETEEGSWAAFTGISARLYVPEGCVEAYQGWADYFSGICVIGSIVVGDYFTVPASQNGNPNPVDMKFQITSENTVGIGWIKDEGGSWIQPIPKVYDGALVIPETVSHQGNIFTMTEIFEWVFQDCAFTSVTIPNTVTAIGPNAFLYNRNLALITCNAQTPPTLGEGAFPSSNNVKIYVPLESWDAYQEAWSEYSSMLHVEGEEQLIGIEFTALNAQGVPIKYMTTSVNSVKTLSSTPSSIRGDLFIPETVAYEGHTFKVTEIGEYSFKDCKSMSSVTIPCTVTRIGTYAFSGSSSLSLVTILGQVNYIGEYAFGNWEGEIYMTLNSEYPPNLGGNLVQWWVCSVNGYVPAGSVQTYQTANNWGKGNYHAIGDTGYQFNTIDEDNICFRYQVTRPSTVKIMYFAEDYWGGQPVTIPAISIPETVSDGHSDYSVTEIAYFYGGSGVKSLVVPSWVTAIDERAFSGCSGLESITVDVGNSNYDSRNNCNAIIRKSDNVLVAGCKNTVIPDNVTAIGMNAFASNNGLTSITIPGSVTSIDFNAFSGCKNLGEVICNAEVPPTLGEYVFDNIADNAKLYVPAESIDSYKNNASWTSYFAESNILPSADYEPFVPAVGKTFALTTEEGVKITYQITSLDATNHKGTVQLYGNYDEQNNIIENAIKKDEESEQIVIPASVSYGGANAAFNYTVTAIGDYAFFHWWTYNSCSLVPYGCTQYDGQVSQQIYLPSTITSIGYRAFCCDDEELTSDPLMYYIKLPEGIESIGDFAFEGRTGLRELTLPQSMTSIGHGAFRSSRNLEKVYVYNPIPVNINSWRDWEHYVIDPPVINTFASKATNEQTRKLYVPYGCKKKYKDYGAWGDELYFKEIITMPNNPGGIATIVPDEYGYSTEFSLEMTADAFELENVVAGGVYYNLKEAYNNGFDEDEGCIVINSSTSDAVMNGISGDFNYAALVEEYHGMVVEVNGEGVVEIVCQTLGAGQLTVRIGDGAPEQYKQNALGFISVHFNVNKPTPIYIYASEGAAGVKSNRMGAPRRAGVAGDNSVKIYKLSIDPILTELAVNMASQMTTFVSTHPLDFSEVTGLRAYTITGFDPTNSKLVLTRQNEVPAGTALLLYRESDEVPEEPFEVPVQQTQMYLSGHLLQPCLVQTTITPTTSDGFSNFILTYDPNDHSANRKIGFYTFNNTRLIPGGKAYLQIPTSVLSGSGESSVKGFTLSFDDDDELTGVVEVKDGRINLEDAEIYNLAGQRMNKPVKGINIVNGKKVLVK